MTERIGISVYCTFCHRRKKPDGRSSHDNGLCSDDCPGYRIEPLPGSLWPDERESEFCYEVGDAGTKLVEVLQEASA